MNETLQRKLYESGRELYKLRFLPCPEECLMDWRGLPRRSWDCGSGRWAKSRISRRRDA